MNCENCIHYEVCRYCTDRETTTAAECIHFKHKDYCSPCFIGQKVWLTYCRKPQPEFNIKGRAEVREGKISMLQQKANKSWKFRVSEGGSVCDYTPDDIGKSVFFEVEPALLKIEAYKKKVGIKDAC